MTALRQRMIEDMQLRNLSEQTQKSYLASVERLAKHYHMSPEAISDEELRQYFLYLRNEKQVAHSTATVELCAIKFLYQHSLHRELETLDLVRPKKSQKLPDVLSVDEVHQLLEHVHRPHHQVCLSTIYACGLRVSEGAQLQISEIDSAREMLHIRCSKGEKDRYIPLPETTLTMLRQHWATHRHSNYLFPARTRYGFLQANASQPMTTRSVQRAFAAGLKESGIGKEATVHTLRHSWATHLLEAGINLRLIQAYLGHRSPQTTALYTHLTHQAGIVCVIWTKPISDSGPCRSAILAHADHEVVA